MNEKPGNTNPRVEQMLRRWGAQQAARQPPRPEAVPSPVGRTFRALMRWTAMAATLLIAAALVLLVVGRLMRGGGTPVATTGPTPEQIDRLEARLAKARDELKALQVNRLEDGRTIAMLTEQCEAQQLQHAEEMAALASDLAKLRKQSAAERVKLADQAKRLTAEVAARRADLSTATRELAGAKAALVGARAEAAGSARTLADLRKRLAAANAEISRAADSHQAALAAAGEAGSKLAALSARQAAMLVNFRRMYLALAAPEKRGWAARQEAARTRRMLARCVQLRSSVRDESAGRLADTLEVLLTRLELLDAGNPLAVRSFADLVAASDVGGSVDAALAAGGQTTEVRQWLLEARLILAGVERVG